MQRLSFPCITSRTRPRAVLALELQRRAMVENKTLAQRCDLLPTMSKYLDPQLVFALSEFTRTRDIYDDRQLLEAQVKLLWNTNMVEFTMDLCKELHGTDTAPAELEERKDVVIQRIGQLHQNAQKIIDVISNQSTIQGLQSDRQSNSTYLKEQFGIGPEQVDTLYQYAKCIYECGQYKAAGELLHQYCTFTLDHLKLLSAMWGKLASEILDCNYIAATDTLSKLKDAIDRHLYTDALKQLQQRTWLLHWSLFIYWNVDDGCTQLLELFTQEVFTVAMQVNSPHLLRYVVAALLVSKPESAEDPRDKWRMRCNAVKRIINSEEYQYSDPLTDFAKAVFIDFDFDRAQEQLQACKEVIANDYFLAEVNEKFTNKARMAIFEVYCRIHQRINLDALATQVGMTRAEAEVWIAQLIRTARLDARIDGSAGIIVMGQQSVDPLDRIIERTNNLSMRTFKIANTIVDAMKPTAAATT